MKKYFFLPLCLCLLVSCTGTQEDTVMPIKRTLPARVDTPIQSQSGATTSVNSSGSMSSSGMGLVGAMVYIPRTTSTGGSLVSSSIMFLPVPIQSGSGVLKAEELTIEKIRAIASLDNLFAINPAIANSTEKNNPHFLDIEKDKLIIGYYLARISDPEYTQLSKERNNITEGRDLWSDELKTVDAQIQAYVNSGGILSEPGKDIMKNKDSVMTSLRESKEYKDYIKSKQPRLDEIDKTINKMIDPEALSAQKEIESLSSK